MMTSDVNNLSTRNEMAASLTYVNDKSTARERVCGLLWSFVDCCVVDVE